MIDIHCHILPGLDDGAKSVSDSLDMAKEAVKEGITTIIATPHHKNGKYDNEKEMILPLVDEINREIELAGIPLKVLPGQETRIYGELLEDYREGRILTLAQTSKYIFIEFPSGSVPRYSERLLYDIQLEGLTPIIVHPERNAELINQPDKLYRLVNNGALTQVTCASLTGYFGKKIQKFSQQIIEANLTHFIASDAHNVTTRTFKMEVALNDIEKRYGIDSLYYFTENAQLLVDQKMVYREVPEKIKKKKFLGLF